MQPVDLARLLAQPLLRLAVPLLARHHLGSGSGSGFGLGLGLGLRVRVRLRVRLRLRVKVRVGVLHTYRLGGVVEALAVAAHLLAHDAQLVLHLVRV